MYRPAPPDLWRVPDALARIRAVLAEISEGGDLVRFLPRIPPGEAHQPLKTRAALASTFVAGLELVRAGAADMAQEVGFGAIRLRAAAGARTLLFESAAGADAAIVTDPSHSLQPPGPKTATVLDPERVYSRLNATRGKKAL